MLYTFAKHRDITETTYNGTISIEEFKQSFYDALESQESLKNELSEMKKDELLNMMGTMGKYRFKNEKKDHIIKALADDVLTFFMLGVYSYQFGQDQKQVMKAKIETITQEDLTKYAEDISKQREEYNIKKAAYMKAFQNPETLEEFKLYIEKKGKGSLSADQLKIYDELVASTTKEKQKEEIKEKSVISQVKGIEGIDLNIIETKHTKTNQPLFVVKLSERVEKEVYNDLNRKAKQLGGWYSSYTKGGAISGFQFKDKKQAEKFIELKEGNVSNIERVEERTEAKEEKRVNKLRENANAIIDRVEKELSKDQLVNTARRARMAGSIESRLEGDRAIAMTMLKIADAIDSGTTKYLDKINSRTQVEQLNSIVYRAHYAYISKLYPNETQKYKDEPPTEEVAAYIPASSMFFPGIYARNLLDALLEYSEYPGLKLVCQRIKKRLPKSQEGYYQVSSQDEMDDIMDFAAKLSQSYKTTWVKEIALEHKRLLSLGIESDEMLRAVVREFILFREGKKEVDKVKELTRNLSGKKVGIDHFPTPTSLAEKMVEEAVIKEGMTVLEPSAGEGNIADVIKNISGIMPDVIEISSELREILSAKGYNIVANDFMAFNESKYDRIIMNPPFSNRMDAEHVQHAFELLKDGGRIVTIMGEGVFFGSDRKAVNFREWTEAKNAVIEELPQGTFKDKTLSATTGANARLVIIDKEVGENDFMGNGTVKLTTNQIVELQQATSKEELLKIYKNHIESGLDVKIPVYENTYNIKLKELEEQEISQPENFVDEKLEAEYEYLAQAGLPREQQEFVIAYMGSIAAMKEMSRERLVAQLIRIPTIGDSHANKIADLVKSNIAFKLKKNGYSITRGEFQDKPNFRISHPDGTISSIPDIGQTLEEVYEFVTKPKVTPEISNPREAAQNFIDKMDPEQLKNIINDIKGALSDLMKGVQDKLDFIESKKQALIDKKEELFKVEKESVGNEKYEIMKQRQEIYSQIKTLDIQILTQRNKLLALKSGGDLTSFDDLKGAHYEEVPDFSKIPTEEILFDEENILTEKMPVYIPLIDEEKYGRRGYTLDAIRISADNYLTATGEHVEIIGDYIILTLDQLVLTNDYYFTKAKALKIKEANEANERAEKYYDSLPEERREKHLNQKNLYNSLPVAVKKKITQANYEPLSWQEKEKLYKFYKRHGIKRLSSKLDDHHMWGSLHRMYERFINPEAVEPKPRTANPEVWSYWENFRDFMSWKIKDIRIQREDLSDIRKAALETSFGESNTDDVLKEQFGILVKRQNGSKINAIEINEISSAWSQLQSFYGDLKANALEVNMKISHTGKKFVFASKAIGTYLPTMNTIAISNKYGDIEFKNGLAHEVAHWIDNLIGKQIGKRYSTDNYESISGQIAFEFRKNLNAKTDSDYINATKECFARAFEQYFAIRNQGEGADLIYSFRELDKRTPYFTADNYVNKDSFYNKIKPLLDKFFEDNKGFFKYALVDVEIAPAQVIPEIKSLPIYLREYEDNIYSDLIPYEILTELLEKHGFSKTSEHFYQTDGERTKLGKKIYSDDKYQIEISETKTHFPDIPEFLVSVDKKVNLPTDSTFNLEGKKYENLWDSPYKRSENMEYLNNIILKAFDLIEQDKIDFPAKGVDENIDEDFVFNVRKYFNYGLNESMLELLKLGKEKVNIDVEDTIRIAKKIQEHDKSDELEVIHIAEAIQYADQSTDNELTIQNLKDAVIHKPEEYPSLSYCIIRFKERHVQQIFRSSFENLERIAEINFDVEKTAAINDILEKEKGLFEFYKKLDQPSVTLLCIAIEKADLNYNSLIKIIDVYENREKYSDDEDLTGAMLLAFGINMAIDSKNKAEGHLEGGLADKMNIADIAAKHNVSIEYATQQLQKGILVEKEHTDNSSIAAEIACDHLAESIEYYVELEKMENKLEKIDALEIKVGETYPHSGGTAKVLSIFDEDNITFVEYEYSNIPIGTSLAILPIIQTQTIEGFRSNIVNQIDNNYIYDNSKKLIDFNDYIMGKQEHRIFIGKKVLDLIDGSIWEIKIINETGVTLFLLPKGIKGRKAETEKMDLPWATFIEMVNNKELRPEGYQEGEEYNFQLIAANISAKFKSDRELHEKDEIQKEKDLIESEKKAKELELAAVSSEKQKKEIEVSKLSKYRSIAEKQRMERRAKVNAEIQQKKLRLTQEQQIEESYFNNELIIKVYGKKLIFNKAGVANLPYNSLIKKIDNFHFVIMYNISMSKDVELYYANKKWNINQCDVPSIPSFDFDSLSLAIMYILDYMHDKYNNIPIETAKDVKKVKTQKAEPEKENVEELERLLDILEESLEQAKNESLKKDIRKEIYDLKKLIEKNS
jgi:phospholipid N-methyltransferase